MYILYPIVRVYSICIYHDPPPPPPPPPPEEPPEKPLEWPVLEETGVAAVLKLENEELRLYIK
jgi:hypothetical protein